VKDHLHVRISKEIKKKLRHYVNLRQMLGYQTSEGKVVEEALRLFDIDERCRKEQERVKRLWEGVK